MYNARGILVGAIGGSGDTSCADHNIAWRTRHGCGFQIRVTESLSFEVTSLPLANVLGTLQTSDRRLAPLHRSGNGSKDRPLPVGRPAPGPQGRDVAESALTLLASATTSA